MGETKHRILYPGHIAWCRNHFAMLADGGVWGIPRSGLMFQKQGTSMVLIDLMPWMPEMEGTITREELREQQEADYEINKAHFEAAGVTVTRLDKTVQQ